MPLAEAERDRGGHEGAADRDQPARARVGAPQPAARAARRARPRSRSRAASRPGRRATRRAAAAARCRRRRGHRRRHRRRRPAPPPAPAAARRPGRPGARGRCSRGSARGCCCRSCPRPTGASRRGQRDTASGHAPPTATIAAPPASAGAAPRSPARRHPQPCRGDPGTTSSAAPILASKPRPTHTPASTIQRVRPSSSARTTHHSAAVQQRIEQRVRVVVAEDGDRDRRRGEGQAGHEAGRAAEAPAGEVVDQRDRRDAHERLRHQDGQRL